MKIVVFGLTISSSWGNGHATLWRGFAHACAERGYRFIFFERDTPYYAMNRDPYPQYGETIFYNDWERIRNEMAQSLSDLLIRRTHVAFETRDHGRSIASRAADLAAPLLGWSEATKQQRIRELNDDVTRIFAID